MRKTERHYDLIVYALVDSLALHSSYSSVRLESFLFTEEAFRDVKAKLKPGGVFALYNFYRQGWVVGRLVTLAEKVFGAMPIVISMPFQESITADDSQQGHITFLLAGAPGTQVVDTIRSRFRTRPVVLAQHASDAQPGRERLWAEPLRLKTDWHDRSATAGGIQEDRPDPGRRSRFGGVPTDDWPFLYLRSR